MDEEAAVDAVPCYGCSATDTRWRGPKLGWLCLLCFCATVEPIVRVVSDDASLNTSATDHLTVPILRHVLDPDVGEQWTLLIFDEHVEEPSETRRLEDVDGPEDAVGEAKWILEKRAWEHHWAALRRSRQVR